MRARQLFLLILFLMILQSFHFAVAQESQDVTIPLVKIKGAQIEEENQENKDQDSLSETFQIQVPNGYGSKVIDSPQNELGVLLNHLEDDPDVSLERRDFNWWRNPSQAQFHGEGMNGYSVIRGRSIKKLASGKSHFEFGRSLDQRTIYYQDNKINPFEPQYSTKASVNNYKENSFIKFHLNTGRWDFLPELDSENKKSFLGSRVNGFSSTQQESLSSLFKDIPSEQSYLVYLRAQQNQFNSEVSGLSSSSSHEVQYGLKYKNKFSLLSKEIPPTQLDLGVNNTNLKRAYSQKIQTQFERQNIQLSMNQPFSLSSWVSELDGKFALRTDLVSDSMESNEPSSYLNSKPNQTSMQPLSYDLGVEVSTPHVQSWGMKSAWRKFTQHPKPSQRFGDGRSLQGNDDLDLSEGLRFSLGPWMKHNNWSAELNAYYEETHNEPIMMATSQIAAKTISIGQIQARGLELKLEKKWSEDQKLKLYYNYQDAVNATSIPWQRGNPLPGRPAQVLKLEFENNQKQGSVYGISYLYKSSEAMDLSNLWHRAPHHDLNIFYGYDHKSWAWRLKGTGLLANYNEFPKTADAGMSGVDLLEPTIDSTEVKFLCEVYL